MKNIFNVSTV